MLISVCCQFFFFRRTIGLFISPSPPSALYQRVCVSVRALWYAVRRVCLCVAVCYCVCASALVHPSLECGSVRALVIVSDRGSCREKCVRVHARLCVFVCVCYSAHSGQCARACSTELQTAPCGATQPVSQLDSHHIRSRDSIGDPH